MKSQHILTCQWCSLCSGILLLLFTCGATMVRLGAPSQYAEVSSPVLKLMDEDGFFMNDISSVRVRVLELVVSIRALPNTW